MSNICIWCSKNIDKRSWQCRSCMMKFQPSRHKGYFIDKSDRACHICQSMHTAKYNRDDNLYNRWYKDNRGYICSNCYNKKRRKPNRTTFPIKSIICSICGSNETVLDGRWFTPKWYKSDKNIICQSCNSIRINIGRKHLSHDVAKRSGANHKNWKGGITPLTLAIRGLQLYTDCRNQVFKRDNYTCQLCDKRSGCGEKIILHMHHLVKTFAMLYNSIYPENIEAAMDNSEFFDPVYCTTVCNKCHISIEWGQ